MPDFLEVCERAARAGGAVLLDWAERFSVREKGPSDLVTEADLASQEVIRRVVLEAFPDHEFLSEEDAPAGKLAPTAGFRWIVDPLDGTTNYVHRVPEYAVSIALEYAGQTMAGTIFNPVSGECYTARAGGGAFLNGRRLHVSGVTELSQALVSVGFPPRVDRDSQSLADFVKIIGAAQSIRRTGSAALNLCYIASGRYDAYCARETKTWDVAAGWLLVTEAGGQLTAPDGTPVRLERPQFLAAGTEELHRQMLKLLG